MWIFGFDLQDNSRETVSGPLLYKCRHFGRSFTFYFLEIVPARVITQGRVLKSAPWLNRKVCLQKREISNPIRPVIRR